MGERESKKQWDAENTERVSLKLNKNTDADILEALDKAPKQTEIKRLVREGLKKAKGMTDADTQRELDALGEDGRKGFDKLVELYRGFDAVDKAVILAYAAAIANGSTADEAKQIANDILASNGKQIVESEE